MKTQEWFSNWFNSPFYHILYSNRDEVEANKFINNLIDYLQPQKDSKILDVACGKGRHSKALAEMGFNVIGIDLAEESINEANKNQSENLHFYVHDMRNLFKTNEFDFVFNFFTSFGYFKTQQENNSVIESMTKSLKIGGMLVIDYLNVHFEEDNFEKLVERKVDNLNFISTKWHTDTHFYKQIQVADDKNGMPRHLSTERVAKFSLGEFNEMLSLQDMQIQNVFGDYSLGHYDLYKSPRMIIIAKKNK